MREIRHRLDRHAQAGLELHRADRDEGHAPLERILQPGESRAAAVSEAGQGERGEAQIKAARSLLPGSDVGGKFSREHHHTIAPLPRKAVGHGDHAGGGVGGQGNVLGLGGDEAGELAAQHLPRLHPDRKGRNTL